MIRAWLSRCFWFAAIGTLWFGLIGQLSVEWSLNAQYTYGWAVPGLCVLLLVRDLLNAPPHQIPAENSNRLDRRKIWLATLLLLAYGLTRLLQEANPDWRFVSWMKALEVIALTLLAGKWSMRLNFPIFPLFFFLVAVPWPTVIEAPVINHLKGTIAIVTSEIIGWFGIPALLQGNVIEIGCGMVGIEEACSGIRSFQASLMVALFFGHWYRLVLGRRIVCLITALVLAIVLNLARTTSLVVIAATKGIAQMACWHESGGVLLPLTCFLGVWLVAMLLQKPLDALRTASLSDHFSVTERFRGFLAGFEQQLVFPVLLLAWVGLVEIGTRIWYSLRESTLPAPISWHIESPPSQSHLCQLPVSDIARQILRFSEALNLSWTDENRFKWQAIFLRWKPGVTAAFLARNHTPSDCLSAAGHELLEKSELRIVPVNGLDLPFRCYVTRTEQGIARVFYCLWEDRAKRRSFDAGYLTYRRRVSAVLAGQRNSGQRSLEIAVWGAPTQEEAEAALQTLLQQILKIDL